MENPTGIDPDFVWTPWGWLRIRGWHHTAVSATPGQSWLSIWSDSRNPGRSRLAPVRP